MPNHFGAKLTTNLSRQEMLFGGGGKYLFRVTGIHCTAKRAFDKALTARKACL